jgi:polyphosphate kinase
MNEIKGNNEDSIELFDRDLSWLSFNGRVLMEAADKSLAVYNRIKFLAIFSSNLDEFFRVRFADIRRIAELDKKKINKKFGVPDPKVLIREILRIVEIHQSEFGRIYRNEIIPELAEQKIHIYQNCSFAPVHLPEIEGYFYSKVLSFLRPRLLLPGDSLFLKNRALYLAAELEDKTGERLIGVVQIPVDDLKRFTKLSSIEDRHYYVFLDDVVRNFMPMIYQGLKVLNTASIKLDRDAELFLGNEFGDGLAEKVKKSLEKREIGVPSRFLFESGMSESLFENIISAMSLSEFDMVPGGRYHNMFDLFSLENPLKPQLEEVNPTVSSHRSFSSSRSILSSILDQDVLLHFPYQHYAYILRFFNEASFDLRVTEIKASIYRVAENSHIINALIAAAENGKKVTVFVEAKARFDEANNLKWATRMSDAGVDVRFSDVKLKVHAKVALVKLEVEGKEQSIAFLGTGNFNEKSAEIYADHALLTTSENLSQELDLTFDLIFGNKGSIEIEDLLVSQVNMVERFVSLIHAEIQAVEKGKIGRITIKLNNIQDPRMIAELYAAARTGVEVTLIIRAICCIKPLYGIRIVRLVDGYLEHARLYCFYHGGENLMYMGSADWMERNLYRRIEVVFPVQDEQMKDELMHCIDLQLNDKFKAVEIGMEMENKCHTERENVRAQRDFGLYVATLNQPNKEV